MKKEKCINLNRKPKLKLVKFDEDSFRNDVTEEQSKIVASIFPFQKVLYTGVLHMKYIFKKKYAITTNPQQISLPVESCIGLKL